MSTKARGGKEHKCVRGRADRGSLTVQKNSLAVAGCELIQRRKSRFLHSQNTPCLPLGANHMKVRAFLLSLDLKHTHHSVDVGR